MEVACTKFFQNGVHKGQVKTEVGHVDPNDLEDIIKSVLYQDVWTGFTGEYLITELIFNHNGQTIHVCNVDKPSMTRLVRVDFVKQFTEGETLEGLTYHTLMKESYCYFLEWIVGEVTGYIYKGLGSSFTVSNVKYSEV